MPCQLSAETPLLFHPDEDQVYALNFTQYGIGSRTIASVTAVSATPTGLTFADEAANAATITGEYGQTVAIGKAAQFSMTGGTAGTDYTITVTVTLSDGSTMVGVIEAWCRGA